MTLHVRVSIGVTCGLCFICENGMPLFEFELTIVRENNHYKVSNDFQQKARKNLSCFVNNGFGRVKLFALARLCRNYAFVSG